MAELKAWTTRHLRLLTYVGSATLVSMWTILRFFTQRTIFDLVGQQVLTQQLVHGGIAGAGIGITNYIPKMFALYLPTQLLPGSPRLKLILLTVLVNIATIILIGLLLEKLLHMFSVKIGASFYIALLWLAAIAGSVFWVQFTNSRNLEVVGGLFLLYEGLRYLERPTQKRLAGIFLFSIALFFADTLQVYMTAVPLILYGLTLYTKNHQWRRNVLLSGALIASYVAAKLALLCVTHILSIHLVQDTNKMPALPLDGLLQGGAGAIKAIARLYSGGIDGGTLRRLLNGIFFITLASAVIYSVWRKLIPQRILLLVGYILVVDISVYILSGEAQQPATERYLIMTAPAVLLLVSCTNQVWQRFRLSGVSLVSILLVANGILLGQTTIQGARTHFSQDAHLASVEHYVAQHPTVLPYASMDTAIPASYLTGSDSKAPLPLSCAGATLAKNNLFYGQQAFKTREQKGYVSAAIILDGDSITNTPSVCSKEAIIAQLGIPMAVTTTDDGSTVLLYGTAISSALHY